MHTVQLKEMGHIAKTMAVSIAAAPPEQKNGVLQALIEHLKASCLDILKANAQDLALARSNGLSPPLLERLSLENKLEGIIEDLKTIIALPDPIGEKCDERFLPNGLKLVKQRTPIGVLGIIYESRPNVTVDISALAIKSGNCAILKGGSETLYTNQVLVELIQKSLIAAGLCAEIVQLVSSSERSLVKELIQMDQYIDLIIPRGNSALQEFCRKNSSIAVITGGIGICHLFVDESADLERSLSVIVNAKTQRPTVCNALDTLLVHAAIAPEFIPKVIERLKEYRVAFRLDERGWEWVHDATCCRMAAPGDWDTEWLSLVLGIKVVASLEEAIEHIRMHSTGHSDGILTENAQNAERFIDAIDSAAIYVNASTRFTDGGQFGLGAEVAISTQKLHARGPMGLKELTSYKWVVRGDYQIRN
jgi:glutamate-5-semialdehyde dehydrogenase